MRPQLPALALVSFLAACAGATFDSAPEPPASQPAAGFRGPIEEESEAGKDLGGDDYRGVPADRKLIRAGELAVSVDDFGPFRTALDAHIDALGGFVADTDLGHVSGRVGWATLVVRVPADRFDDLVAWTESRVEVERMDIDSVDVTEEWVDVDSRIANHKKTEARLLRLLDQETADLEDVLAVERELSRVRGEIERFEGRMRVLSDRVSLATLTLRVNVRNPYDPAVEQALLARLGDTFGGSVGALVTFGEGMLIIAVGLAPWVLVFGLLFTLLFRVVRSVRRRRAPAV